MSNEQQMQILQAIRQDDVDKFDALVGKHKNLCFGRFSLLSICYLYHSRRILRRYAAAMRQAPATQLDEVRQVYNDFADRAGCAIRLWAGYAQHDVHPLHMLAVLGDWSTLRREFATYVLGEDEQSRLLTAIKLCYKVQASVQNGQLVLPPKPLSQRAKRFLPAAGSAVLVVILTAIAVLTVGLVFRAGTPLGSAEALEAALPGKQYVLSDDIEINGPAQWADFVLDGGGHTITVAVRNEPLLAQFAGTVSNCTIVLDMTDNITVGQSYACLCLTNNGTWQNVHFVFNQGDKYRINLDGFTRAQEDVADTCAFGGLFVQNNGVVQSCTLSGKMQWYGQAQVDGQMGLVACNNAGTIADCTIEGGIACDTLDVGGVAFCNDKTGVIRGCVLAEEAIVAQTTSVYQWSPMAGGITAQNYGLIENAQILGSVLCVKQDVEFPEGNISVPYCYIHAGGVTAHNYSTVFHSLVTGEIRTAGDYTATYIGGVAATNNRDADSNSEPNSYGTLEENIVTGRLYAHAYELYMGGIVGASAGRMRANCYNCNQNNYPSWSNYVFNCCFGSLMGFGNFEIEDALLSDNHVLRLYSGSSLAPVIGYYKQYGGGVAVFDGVTTHATTDFDTMEVYWYAQAN